MMDEVALSLGRFVAPSSEEAREVGGEGSIEGQPFAGDGVGKFEVGGVEKLALGKRRLRAAIDGVADDGMIDSGEMDTDLMGAPGLKL